MPRNANMRIVVCLVMIAALVPATASTQVLVAEDFDAYTLGTYPPAPWWNMFSGVSALVSTEQSATAPHSLRMESQPNWARWDCMTMTLPDRIMYVFNIYFTDATRGASVGFGFVEPGVPNTGWVANAITFANDGNVYFVTRTHGSTLIGTWGPNQWIAAWSSVYWVEPGFLTPKAFAGVSGYPWQGPFDADPQVLPASYYGVEVPLNDFGVFANNFAGTGTSVFYVDDIRIEQLGVLPTEPITWGRIKSLYAE